VKRGRAKREKKKLGHETKSNLTEGKKGGVYNGLRPFQKEKKSMAVQTKIELA